VVVLGVIAIVLFACVIGVFAYFSSEVALRDNVIATQNEEILSLESEIETLEEQVSDLQDQVKTQQNEVDALQNQLVSLENQLAKIDPAVLGAKVINVGLGARDENSASEPYLYVSGYVCNVGSETAYNVTLHVTAYRDSVQVINYHYKVVDSLGRYDAVYVEASFYYSGSALTVGSWVMTPEWA
jgi:uncharacterized coiled-coil protein SlyX